jgi:acyl-coenzyme A synthetase/AMP-(fatty) acid ligase
VLTLPSVEGCAGQAIAIDMPMTVESVIAYFGIVLAGCAVVSIADSFAAAEIATRLHIAKAVAIVTQVRLLIRISLFIFA